MAKHVDIDACGRYLFGKIGFSLVSLETVLDHMADYADHNSADVVPKSEIDRLKVEGGILEQECGKLMGRVASLEIELEAMRSAANSYKMHYENLAREIFEEIEKILSKSRERYSVGGYNYDHYKRDNAFVEAFAELKKKYTEDT